MTAVQFEQLAMVETDEVLQWRYQELVRGGFDPNEARQLASRLDVDLHQAVELLRDGCPQATALLILL